MGKDQYNLMNRVLCEDILDSWMESRWREMSGIKWIIITEWLCKMADLWVDWKTIISTASSMESLRVFLIPEWRQYDLRCQEWYRWILKKQCKNSQVHRCTRRGWAISYVSPAGRLFYLNFLWTTVEFARFPVRFLGYRANFTFKKCHILVEKYDLPDYGA